MTSDDDAARATTASGADTTPGDTEFDDAGFTSAPPSGRPLGAAAASSGGGAGSRETRWHGGLDLALLVLRVVLGATMAAHGAQKLFGAFGGPGIGGFGRALAGMGYHGPTTLLAWITALTEIGGGALLVLGLFTPLGAAAVLGVGVNIIVGKAKGGFFATGGGIEYEVLLSTVALALLLTGPGRIAIDVHTPWRRRPMPFAVVGLLLAAGAAVLVLVLFH